MPSANCTEGFMDFLEKVNFAEPNISQYDKAFICNNCTES